MKIIMTLAFVLALGIGYAVGQNKNTASVNPEVAWFQINGSRLSHTANKRLTFVSLHYNSATVPCILVDTQAGSLSYETVGNAAISCGWTPEAIQVIGSAGR